MTANKEALLELRSRTRAGMQDCLKTLAETGGDLDRAEALLVERGLAAAAGRADRETPEGRVFLHRAGSRAALVQLECETDFVALGADFRALGRRAAELACARPESAGPELQALAADFARVTKENIVVRKSASLAAGLGEELDGYVHGDGSIGSLVLCRGSGQAGILHDLALQVAAFAPEFLDEASVPDSYRRDKLAEFRAKLEEEGELAGKGESLIQAILAGKLRRHLSRACLLSQAYVKDDKRSVGALLEELAARGGERLEVLAYARCQVGEP